MATVNLDRGNFVLLGKNDSTGVYTEVYAKILDMSEDASRPGTHWIKIKEYVNTREMTTMENISQISSSELTTVPKLEIFSAEDGVGILETLRRRISENEARAEEAERARVMSAPVEESDPEGEMTRRVREAGEPADINGDARPYTGATNPNPVDGQATVRQNRTTRLRGEAPLIRSDEVVQAPVQEPAPSIMPSLLEPEGENLQVNTKTFNTGLYSGDMKTIIAIAEEAPEKVFNVLNQSIIESGHLVMALLSKELRAKIIDLKILELQTYQTITIQKNGVYSFMKEGVESQAVYLGDNTWMFTTVGNDSLPTQDGFIKIHPEVYKDYMVSEITGPEVNGIVLKVGEMLTEIDRDVKDMLESSEDSAQIIVKNPLEKEKYDSTDIGQEWVSAITYAYLLDTNINWEKIDARSFKDVEAIGALAQVRQDEVLLEELRLSAA